MATVTFDHVWKRSASSRSACCLVPLRIAGIDDRARAVAAQRVRERAAKGRRLREIGGQHAASQVTREAVPGRAGGDADPELLEAGRQLGVRAAPARGRPRRNQQDVDRLARCHGSGMLFLHDPASPACRHARSLRHSPHQGPPRLPGRRARIVGRPGHRPRQLRAAGRRRRPFARPRSRWRRRRRGAPACRSATSSARASRGSTPPATRASRPPDRRFSPSSTTTSRHRRAGCASWSRAGAATRSTTSSAGRSDCGWRDRGCACAVARSRRSPPSTAAFATVRSSSSGAPTWRSTARHSRSPAMFDAGAPLHGFDEEMWERRLREAGGRIMYLARAGLVHRRDRRDARLRSLMRGGIPARPPPARLQRTRGARAEPARRAAHPRRLRLPHLSLPLRQRHPARGLLGRACASRRCRRDERRAGVAPSSTSTVCCRARAASCSALGRARARTSRT